MSEAPDIELEAANARLAAQRAQSRLPGRARHLRVVNTYSLPSTPALRFATVFTRCGRAGSTYLMTDDPEKVDCRLCLRAMKKRASAT